MTDITITGRRHFNLSSPIANPSYDRRCKYDAIRSRPEFEAGTVVTVIEQTVTSDVLPEPYTANAYEIDFRRVPESVKHLFVAQDPGQEVDAETIEEVSKREHSDVSHICERAIRKLIKSGVLTESQVIDAYYTAYEDEE